jgi:hypothetical protein
LREQLLAISTIARGTLRASALGDLCHAINEFRHFGRRGTLLAIKQAQCNSHPLGGLVKCFA